MEGMPGIRSALEPCHDRILSGKNVYYLAFAFISPLETENNV